MPVDHVSTSEGNIQAPGYTNTFNCQAFARAGLPKKLIFILLLLNFRGSPNPAQAYGNSVPQPGLPKPQTLVTVLASGRTMPPTSGRTRSGVSSMTCVVRGLSFRCMRGAAV